MPYASHVYMHINIWPIPRVDEEKYYGVDEEKYCRRNFLHRLGKNAFAVEFEVLVIACIQINISNNDLIFFWQRVARLRMSKGSGRRAASRLFIL